MAITVDATAVLLVVISPNPSIPTYVLFVTSYHLKVPQVEFDWNLLMMASILYVLPAVSVTCVFDTFVIKDPFDEFVVWNAMAVPLTTLP